MGVNDMAAGDYTYSTSGNTHTHTHTYSLPYHIQYLLTPEQQQQAVRNQMIGMQAVPRGAVIPLEEPDEESVEDQRRRIKQESASSVLRRIFGPGLVSLRIENGTVAAFVASAVSVMATWFWICAFVKG